MYWVFVVITHLFSVAAILAMVFFIFAMICQDDESDERLVRSIAAAVPLLIYGGSRAIGLSIPHLLDSILERPTAFSIGVFGIAIPASIGATASWFSLRMIHYDSDLAKRSRSC